MDDTRFHQKPWFYAAAWTVGLGVLYLIAARWQENGQLNLLTPGLDGLFFLLGLVFWLGFFAQFVLPVRRAADRWKIFYRLLLYLIGSHGPAVFVKDGNVLERKKETKRRGPGVIWLDTASGAVTRTAVRFKRAIGPGVYFTEGGEYLAGTVDLHTQTQRIGPHRDEDPFAARTEGQTDIAYKQIQEHRHETSALTRDGIEVVPNITVIFKLAGRPASGSQEGSRFGFDPDAVFKAVTGEGVNPMVPMDDYRRRVAWNELPARLAADLWREYLSKFTLSQLFEANQPIPPGEEDQDGPSLAVQASAQLPPPTPARPAGGLENVLAPMLRALNSLLDDLLGWLEGSPAERPRQEQPSGRKTRRKPPAAPGMETALQAIVRQINLRMKNLQVETYDRVGDHTGPRRPSPEFNLLQERGLEIFKVSVGPLRFPADVEQQLVRQWTANWLENARKESGLIDGQRSLAEQQQREETFMDYGEALSRDVAGLANPDGGLAEQQVEMLKALLRGTRRELVRDNRLHKRLRPEVDELTDFIQWLDRAKL
jgi:hypothetical protein